MKAKRHQQITLTLFDDESVRKKLEVMDKWEAMWDDSRNDTNAFVEAVDDLLEFGGTYRVTVERVNKG